MPTTSLTDPIDGAELKAIILHRIAAALDKDCTLVNDIAYAGFALKYSIHIEYKRSKTPPTVIWGDLKEGDVAVDTAEVGSTITHNTVEDKYESDSPNTAREEHDLPVPVMIKTPSGETRRKIHINPPKAKVTA